MATRNVTYKCPFCDKRFNRADLVIHIEEVHPYELPKDFTALRYVFNYVNKKPLSYHGKCTECGGPTPWDENAGRYKRQCGSKKCHDSYVKKFEDNMIRTTGNTRISQTEDGQKKMLANRKISGTYKFKNGKEKTYTGSYEKKALEFMDLVMNIDPDDLMCPGPILEYKFEGKKHIYITDFYYQPYDLVIEVKDGGDNPNKRNMPEYRAKQIAKEEYIIKKTNYNYLRLTDNNLQQLLAVFMDLKMQLVNNTNNRVIHVNEQMGTCMSIAPVAGLEDSDAYITLEPKQNNVFSAIIGANNGKKRFGLSRDTNKLEEVSDDYKILGTKYKIPIDRKSLSENISKLIENDVELDYKSLYKLVTCSTLYTDDQIKLELEPFFEETFNAKEFIDNILYYNEDIDMIEKSIKELMNERV